jgi:hypothetical protein
MTRRVRPRARLPPTCPDMYVPPNACTCPPTHVRAPQCVCTPPNTNMNPNMNAHPPNTYTHSRTRTHTPQHVCTLPNTNTCPPTRMHAPQHIYAPPNTNTHPPNAYTCSPTRTCAPQLVHVPPTCVGPQCVSMSLQRASVGCLHGMCEGNHGPAVGLQCVHVISSISSTERGEVFYGPTDWLGSHDPMTPVRYMHGSSTGLDD